MLEQVEPWGERRLDYHFARLMAFIGNIVRGKGTSALSTEDFMVDWQQVWSAAVGRVREEEVPEPEPAEAIFDKVSALNTWFGGTSQ